MNLIKEVPVNLEHTSKIASRPLVKTVTLFVLLVTVGLAVLVQPAAPLASSTATAAGDPAPGSLVAGIPSYWDDIFAEPGANGPVNALVTAPDGTLYAGGQFTVVAGQVVNRIAAWDGSQWHTLGGGMNGTVHALAVAPDGTLYAGGQFTQAGGVAANRIARWDGSQWHAMDAGFNGIVFALTVKPNGELYAGGTFTDSGNRTLNYIGRWDGTSWQPLANGTNGFVYALAAAPDSDIVYVGGAFTQAGGLAINRIGRYSSSGWASMGTGANGNVLALVVDREGTLYAGGDFTSMDDSANRHVAEWDGGSWGSAGGGLNGRVSALGIQPGTGALYAAGDFIENAFDFTFTGRVAKWDGNGPWRRAFDFSDGPNNSVYALAFGPGLSSVVYAGGRFTTVDNLTVNRLAVVSLSTGWYGIGQPLNNTVFDLALAPNGHLYAGGRFTQVAGAPAGYVATWLGRLWSDMGGGVSGRVDAMTVAPDGALYVSGRNGYVSRWNGNDWSQIGSEIQNAFIRALAAAPDGTIYAAMDFDEAPPAVLRWNGNQWQSLGEMNNPIEVLAVAADGTLYAGGYFTQAGGVAASRIARWDGSRWRALGSGISGSVPLNGVAALVVAPDGDLYAGGVFDTAGGSPAHNVARWDGSQWYALGEGTDLEVLALALDPNGILFAGGFYSDGGNALAVTNYIAVWNGSEWSSAGNIENSQGTAWVYALTAGALPDSSEYVLYVGGEFDQAGGHEAFNIARHRYTPFPADGAPTAVDDVYTTLEETPLTVAAPGVLGNDSDPGEGSLTAALESTPANGSVTLNANGSFIYVPNSGFSGSDSFTYTASDGPNSSNVATAIITVEDVNSAPTAAANSYTTVADTPLTIAAPGVLDNDSDPDGDVLTAVLDSNPGNGSVALNTDGSFTYTPAAGFTGSDSFTYRASDGSDSSNTAAVTITVLPAGANAPPTAVGDGYLTPYDTALTIAVPGVLGNDTDPDGDSLTAVLDSDPGNGSVTLNANGSFIYVPNSGFSGSDSFTYTASDGPNSSYAATVTITVEDVNNAPVAAANSYSTVADTPLTIAAPGVLDNDSDPDGDSLTAVLDSNPGNGSVALNADGSLTYVPNAGFVGQDSFTYRASDGSASSDTATVMITVLPAGANAPPTAVADSYLTPYDTALTIAAPGVLANDSDANGDELTAVLDAAPTNGSVTLNGDGSFTYTPAAGFSGSDSFAYYAEDGTNRSHTTIVTITVVGQELDTYRIYLPLLTTP